MRLRGDLGCSLAIAAAVLIANAAYLIGAADANPLATRSGLAASVVVPGPLRDRLYNWVARNRYAWFGRKDRCFVPPPGAQRRFVED